jgi:hypothetical protein
VGTKVPEERLCGRLRMENGVILGLKGKKNRGFLARSDFLLYLCAAFRLCRSIVNVIYTLIKEKRK